MDYKLLPAFLGALGLCVAFFIFIRIQKAPAGSDSVKKIAKKIQHGAMIFLKRELIVLVFFMLAIGGALLLKDKFESMAFFMGAIASTSSGFIGMYAATRANVRTAVAANEKGAAAALNISFLGGSIMGTTIASMGLLGIGSLFFFFGKTAHDIHVIHGFAMGASLVALFFRVGGGIFTKAADVGADLVGKVEEGMPEDDPRNPAVIADNVGDNVGDVAGMGSDIFESYCGSQIATMAIAATLPLAALQNLYTGTDVARTSFLTLPLALTSIGLICSFIGMILVKFFSVKKPLNALRIGTFWTTFLFIVLALVVTLFLDLSTKIWGCIIAGALGGSIIGLITEYYTAGRPVQQIANSSKMGVAPVMISGLSVGLQSVAVPLLTYAAIILLCSELAGIYGVAIAAVGMLSTVGITMAVDAYGPIADNAGGIAQMSGMPEKTREITDSLDEVGNTTAAIGKGFAIGAAGLAALALITAYINTLKVHHFPNFTLELNDPFVLAGLFIGGMIPFLVSSIAMNAVGKAAYDMIAEIRRQFKQNPAIKKGDAEPDADKCIAIATDSALKRMLFPSMIAVFAPVLVGFVIGAAALGGMLAGALLSGILLALMMANSGGAWDNAKKYIEKGHHGGKDTEEHKACVVGDTVGDPLKDTAGPSMNILINVMAIVSLVIAPLLSR